MMYGPHIFRLEGKPLDDDVWAGLGDSSGVLVIRVSFDLSTWGGQGAALGGTTFGPHFGEHQKAEGRALRTQFMDSVDTTKRQYQLWHFFGDVLVPSLSGCGCISAT